MEQTFNKAIDILYLAKQHNVDIILNGEQLQLKIPENKTIDKDLLDAIRANKQLIIDYLSNDNLRSAGVSKTNYEISSFNRDAIDYIPLSFSQERLWFIDRLEGSVQYHLPSVLRLKGNLNRDILKSTLLTIINRHEVLRTIIRENDGQGYQQIMPAGGWELKITEELPEGEEALNSCISNAIDKPFDLSKDYMLRAELIRLSLHDHVLVVTMHHIASDAWSRSVMVREVVEIYKAHTENREVNLPPLSLQFADFAVWQRNYMQGEVLQTKLDYWKNKLDDVATLQLPADYSRPLAHRLRGSKHTFKIDSNLSAKVQALGQANGATLYMTLLAAFKILLYRYSGQQDICVGTSVAGRPQQELEGLIGFFVNTLALRDQVTDDLSFTNFLAEVKNTTLEAYAHQEVPFEKIVETVVKERVAGISPLFQVMLVLNNTPEVPQLRLGELSLSAEAREQPAVKFDLTFFVKETEEGFQCTVEYNADLYSEGRVEKMAAHFVELLHSIVVAPQTKVGQLEILTKAEENELIAFGQNESQYPKDQTIGSLFEQQAAKHPEAIALVFEETRISYKALNERANQLAHYLRSKGVKENTLVPLLIERGAEMLIAILGILKAGGAYVPIDTDFPIDRISYMLEDTKAAVVITSSTASHKLPQGITAEIIELDEERATLRQQPTATPTPNHDPNSPAYVIYTSGSTGKPKGVLISNQNIADYVYGLEERIKISENKSFALVSTIATDLGNTVLYGSLLTGGTLHVFTKETVSHIEAIHEYFSQNEIDCLKIVPSHWKALTLDGRPLLPKKQLIFGGEALQKTVVDTIQATGTTIQVINHYGPTETTIGKLLHEVDQDSSSYGQTIPIGKPFSNTKAYVLSKELRLCPVGVPGQLYIAGDGLAKGYLNNAALTAEKFITNPFDPSGKTRMYGTGDKVQYQSDGNILFIGRVDDQVKIRGYRVEPGEVGRILEQSEYINQAVVVARDDKQGNKQLIGYIVANEDYDKQELQEYLKEQLPDYMIPSHIVELSSLPLTQNGKIDRKALPDPEVTPTDQYTAPQNETEAKLKAIWEEVLEIDDISTTADFFEIGGHSLLAVRLISMIRKSFGMELPISDVFDYPTVAGLAVRLSEGQTTAMLPAVKAEARPEYIPLSFSQERLWFIDRLEGSVQYHVPSVLRLKGEPDKKALEQTLQAVINRHEVLRTVIREHDGRGYQQIMPASGWTLGLTEAPENKEELTPYIANLISKPFDLSADYMLRAELIKISEDDHILLVTMHHIASDGWSKSILVKEVIALYEGYAEGRTPQLPELAIQYADYALWQQKYLQGEVLEHKLSYWKGRLEGTVALQLPTDYSRPVIQSSRGASLNFRIDKELSGGLQSLSQSRGVTLYMTLLSAFKVLLYRYSGQEDICIGTPVAGRNQQELEGLIGFFINTLALRSQVRGDMPFTTLLEEVRATTLEAYGHQEVPFEKVVDAVVKTRDRSRNPLFQVLFSLQNTPEVPVLKLGELRLSSESKERTTAQFDLSFMLRETSSGIQGTVEYGTDLYRAETIERMISHYTRLLGSIVAMAGEQVGRLVMLGEAEEAILINRFNDTAKAYPKDKSLVDLIQEQAAGSPESIAIIFENEQLSYKELNERSNQLARYLQQQGVKSETLVPVCVERGPGMIIGILGILKAGGAYVPIDPEYPAERISYMLKDTAATVILSNAVSKDKLKESSAKVIALDSDWKQIAKEESSNLQLTILPEQLAYMIYTSGSTGKPKGAMNAHAGIVNRLLWTQEYFGLSSADAILQKTTFCFDVSVWELFWPLIAGARLVFAKPGGQSDSAYLKSLIDSEKITLLHFVPSMLSVFLSDLEEGDCLGLKNVLCSGESLSPSQVNLFTEKLPSVQLHNLYGPTEAAIDVSCWSYTEKEEAIEIVPIGKPVANTQLYILNADKGLNPLGVAGELYIGGVQVGRGYLNRPELTAEKFIQDPFSRVPGARLYRTGDMARWLADGNIEYLGRIDDQVKIRGYRIELGEIENVLNLSGLVRQSVVLAKEDKQGTKRLVGYVVSTGRFDKQNIQAYLSTKLPEYMVPALWVEMESIPVTANGKTDKKALPDADLTEMTAAYAAPRNAIEAKLAEIWQELLGLEQVGIYDNFFELGGDSILTIQVVSRMRRSGHHIQPKDIFNHQSIGALSEAIHRGMETVATGEQGILSGSFGLLPIQQWYLERADQDISHYNQSVLLKIDKGITAAALQAALLQLTGHHDALRLSFERQQGEWQQTYKKEQGQLLLQEDLRQATAGNLKSLIAARSDVHQRSLSIAEGKLLRIVWMQTPQTEESNRLLIVIHHLAVDGVSWRIVLEDLDQLMNGLMSGKEVSLGSKSSSYRQWQEALASYGASHLLLIQKPYWEQVSGSYLPFPVDQSYSGELKLKDMGQYQVKLGSEPTRRLLQEVPKVYHTEINDLLLSALSAALCSWSGRDNVVIGLEGHGREAISPDIDSSRTVGWFTSLYPVLLKRGTDQDTLIKGVKEALRRVPDKGLGYGVLKYINEAANLQGSDPWDIIFNYLGQLDTAAGSSRWFNAAGENSGTPISEEQFSPSRLSVNGHIFRGELLFRWSYSSRHYNAETISKLAEIYIKKLAELIAHCLEQAKSGLVFTPSDYGLGAEVGYEELDLFLAEPYLGDRRRHWVESLYRLSGLQQGMLFHGLYDSFGSYIEQFGCDLVGMNREALLSSWSEVISRHSILRSAFYYDSFSVPVQCVYREVELPIEELDYRGLDAAAQAESLQLYEAADRVRGFDFKSAPLMRLGLVRLDEDRYRMLWTSHHLLFDGWSMPVLIEEFLSTYELLISGQALPEAEEDRYEDYIRYLERKDKSAEEQYWRSYLQKITQGTLLPFVSTTSNRTKGIGKYGSISITLDALKTNRIQNYAQSHRLTVNTLMQGVWAWLLHNYTGEPDVVYGVVVSGRPAELASVERRVGMYINTLPLLAVVDADQDTVSWLQGLQAEQVASREYQYTALRDVQQWTGIKDDLFDSLLTFENYPVSKLLNEKTWSLKAENVQFRAQSNYPLTIIIGNSEELSISFNYNTGILEAEYVESIRHQFEQVLLQITAGLAGKLSDIRLLTAPQEHQLLVDFNDSSSTYPKDKTIAALFEQQAANYPDTIAITFEETRISYKALNERANQLAYYLRSKGVKENTLVPLLIERGAEMLIAILGILKAGGAYVPIDTDFPIDRISYMLEDTKATVVITSSTASYKLPQGITAAIIELDEERATLRQQPTGTPATNHEPNSPAYVIYTSGSTGKPKGVEISHVNVVDYVYGLEERIKISENKSFALVSTIATDLGNTVLYGSLLTGGTLHVFTKETVSHIEAIHEYFSQNEIDCLKIVPSHWKALTLDGRPLLPKKQLIFGGEALQKTVVDTIQATGTTIQVINHYGPTETTIGKLLHEVDQDSSSYGQTIPIGKPFSNTKAYVLSKELRLCPVGVPGQLYIAGDGLAKGYLNNAALTAEKFITNPFDPSGKTRMYGTGDKVQYQSDGNILFIGRVDDQVKIRGYRVEPGEVGRILEQSEYINQAVVVARDDKQGNKQLIGYIVANEDYDKQELQEYLKEQLPDYMIPSHIVELSSLPLTQNGKIDRKALPDPEVTPTDQYTAPQNETEAKLKAIWEEVLEIDDISTTADFFEIGGHSLLAVRLISMIRKSFGMELPISDVFDYPTVAGLAVRLSEGQTTAMLPGVKAEARPEYIPLSFSQERLWFIDRLEGSVQYHVPSVLRLKGEPDKKALEQTLQTVINRHEVLRTVIREHDGRGYQQIMPASGWTLGLTEAPENKEELTPYIANLISKPFDLSADYMLRAELIKISEDDHILLVTMHHIASDGWSKSILVKEVIALYEGYAEGRTPQLPELAIQYADYALWQQKYLQGEVLEHKLSYWKGRLEGTVALQLPTDYSRPVIQSSRGASLNFRIDKELSGGLQSLSQSRGVTLYMTLLSAFKVLLYRYSGQEDICIGTPVAGRNQQELEGLIGFFINTLALRSQVRGDMPFTTLLEEVRATTLEAYGHQEVPFEKVVDAVVKTRDRSRNPLFQVLFSLQNTPEVPVLKLGELRLSSESKERTTAQFDLSFMLRETSSGIQGTVEYGTDLYRAETIERMISHYTRLLGSIVAMAGEQVGRLVMLGEAEEAILINRFNDTAKAYPKDKSLVDLIQEQAAGSPESIAIIFENEQLSYKELNERSNQLARYLQQQGVKSETLVPVCVERGPGMIIGILGILKAGGAYVPIDPEYPAERISYMLKDTGAKLVLSSTASRANVDAGDTKVIAIDGDWAHIQKEPGSNLQTAIHPEQLAYVIYTSGSTGKPKGVMIEHQSVYSFIAWCRGEFSTTDFDIVYATTSICFDLSVFEMFYPLSTGKPVRILENGLAIADYLADDSAILINTVPSVIQSLLSTNTDLSRVSILNMAGEPISLNIVEGLDTAHIIVRNLYGPTEDTTYSTMYTLEKGKPVLIGKPISNTKIHLLDAHQRLVPTGVTGEICIGGAGLARGYLNLPELTAEKFIKDPFSKTENTRLYRTGDLGRWHADGNIEYLGRIDDQVKIRGYRIELGEIESVLNQSGLVSQAVVLAKEDSSGNKRLIGYIVPETFDKQNIQAYLSTKLPEYMVPALWVALDRIPLTPNGKVDRKALPDPDLKEMIAEYTAPRNETEQTLAYIWQGLLGLEHIGIHDNFFELGGHSLLAMRVVSAIREELKAEVTVRDLFTNPDIASLGKHIDKQNKGPLLPEITVGERPKYIPLSFSQERLWFIDRLDGSVQYHIPAVLRLRGELQREVLENTLRAIVVRHEVLRTVIREHEGMGYQQIISADNWSLRFTKITENEAALSAYIGELTRAPFNLSQDFMLRADLIGLAQDDHVLVVTMHHISSDEWSRSILVKEVLALYEGYANNLEIKLPELAVQYADYAIWQRKYIQGEVLENKLAYWQAKLEDVATLQLPADYNHLPRQNAHGGKHRFKIEEHLSAQLQSLSRQQGATLYMTMLAAFNVLLHRYSGQEDICVGTSVVNRPQRELEALIGYYVNTLALRSKVSGDMSFIELLEDVKETTLEAYANQEVPFEKVVEAVVKERVVGRSPLFQVMLVLINTPDVPALKLGNLNLSGQDNEYTISKFDITFFIRETNNGFQVSIQYNADLFSEERITRMAVHFNELLTSLVSSPETAVGRLEMLSQEERMQMLANGQSLCTYPRDVTVVDLFEAQVLRYPEKKAVAFAGKSVTYKELDIRANILAFELRRLGVTKNSLVPLYIGRGIDMITGILGILKAGAAYVPIDTDIPEERVSYILKDTGAFLAVSSAEYSEQLQDASTGYLEVVVIESLEKTPTAITAIDPAFSSNPESLAYVIYTSGSTGKPKGVLISHGNLIDYVYGLDERTNVSGCSSFALVSTIATDLGNTVLYSSLLFGGTLHVFAKETVSHIEELHEYFEANKIDCLKIVPSHWKALSPGDAPPLLPRRLLIFGGEALPADSADRIRKYDGGCRVFNHYGPTETTIGKLLYEAGPQRPEGRQIPIGRPFSNTAIYILSKNKMLCPVGVPGELFIAGAGLAQGYLNLPELSSERFIADPYGNEGGRMYSTGDQVQYLNDGSVLFIGRVDDQVKIRGYRVEPGEVGRILEESDLVDQAIVLSREDKQGNNQLVAYIVARGEFDSPGIQAYLKQQLPDYMIPAHVVPLISLPLTANGKVNRKALPDPEMGHTERGYLAPRNESEIQMAGIWQDVLELDKVGIEDNFFEMGGHSLLAVRLISLVRKVFGKELPINDVFVYPTIASLTSRLESENIETTRQLLIPIKSSGTKVPLYIICGSGGTILKFVEFVKMLDADQPVYGFQQPTELMEFEEFPNTTEGIAKIYVKEILKQNPIGPYALSGHCFGGKIALEMAVQLKAMGKKVSMLALFDVFTKDVEEIIPASINNYYRIPDIIKKYISKISLKITFEAFLILKHPKQALRYKIEKTRSIMGQNEANKGDIEMEFNKVTKLFKTASRNYQMRHYEDDILVFYAKDKHYFTDWNKGIVFKKIAISDEKKYAWVKYARSARIYEVKGEHSTIFNAVNATEFSKILQAHLDEGQVIDTKFDMVKDKMA